METLLLVLTIFIVFLLVVILFIMVRFSSQFSLLNNNYNNLLRIQSEIDELDTNVNQAFKEYRNEITTSLKDHRVEMSTSINQLSLSLNQNLQLVNKTQFEKMDRLIASMTSALEKVKEQVDKNLSKIQSDNNTKLEEIKNIVDEKLQQSVEKRFNESFKLISERLDMVQKGLGEMQTLATGVGDLKKVLTNVKTRGNLGEIQLKNILEQVLTPQQYVENAQVSNTNERVEFAIKLPGNDPQKNSLLLPIDSKFPMEDYARLLDAYESSEYIESAKKAFENAVKKNAKDIHQKYINPPVTTDFAIMFVPTEGLYAEILRVNGLFEMLQRDLKISVVGPSNLVAFLSSLQMGFKTLAIEKRSSEVWQLLSSIKNEFNQFGGILDKTKKKLQEATNVIDQASTRTRVIQRKLSNVELLEDDYDDSVAEIETD